VPRRSRLGATGPAEKHADCADILISTDPQSRVADVFVEVITWGCVDAGKPRWTGTDRVSRASKPLPGWLPSPGWVRLPRTPASITACFPEGRYAGSSRPPLQLPGQLLPQFLPQLSSILGLFRGQAGCRQATLSMCVLGARAILISPGPWGIVGTLWPRHLQYSAFS